MRYKSNESVKDNDAVLFQNKFFRIFYFFEFFFWKECFSSEIYRDFEVAQKSKSKTFFI